MIYDRLSTDERFAAVEEQPVYAPERLVCRYGSQFYPESVREARLEIVWYDNGDFTLHYHEDGTFDHRWDRHPTDHNERDHVHPGPDAPTPGEDTSHPPDWRDALADVLAEIEDRQRSFWEQK